MKRTVYYAHPISIYGTSQENRDMGDLIRLGFDPYNPNCAEMEAKYQHTKDMAVFREAVSGCEALAFRAFPDGSIPAGIAKEIAWAVEMGKPVFEMPSAITRRALSVDATREVLRECGKR
jgi:hypothetical protein